MYLHCVEPFQTTEKFCLAQPFSEKKRDLELKLQLYTFSNISAMHSCFSYKLKVVLIESLLKALFWSSWGE